MRALVIDPASEEPVYGQIARQIREAIVTRALPPGRSLPGVRTVAGDLGVNLNTVARAYRRLQEEGFLEIHRRAGARVVGPPAQAPPERLEPLRRDLRDALSRLRQAGLDLADLKKVLDAELADLVGRRRG